METIITFYKDNTEAVITFWRRSTMMFFLLRVRAIEPPPRPAGTPPKEGNCANTQKHLPSD